MQKELFMCWEYEIIVFTNYFTLIYSKFFTMGQQTSWWRLKQPHAKEYAFIELKWD